MSVFNAFALASALLLASGAATAATVSEVVPVVNTATVVVTNNALPVPVRPPVRPPSRR